MKQNIVFLFRKTTHIPESFKPFVVHFTDSASTSPLLLGPFTKAILRFSQGIFHSFDMRNSTLMRHVNLYDASVLMRVFMLGNSLCKYGNEGYNISATNIPHVQNSIVIAHKSIRNNKRLLWKLKRNNNVLLIDIIDGVMKTEKLSSFSKNLSYSDGIICCSHKSLEYFAKNFPDTPTYFVQHYIDQRIGTITPSTDYFSPYYFGAPENLLLFDSIKPLLNIVYTNNKSIINNNCYLRLPEANFHYAVRQPVHERGSIRYKPFLKGFTAAFCNANILVHADDGDALHYLGEDYPYLIKEELCEKVVLRYMQQAKVDFGTGKWRYGLKKMAQLRKICSEQAMAEQFWNMIQRIGCS